MGSSKINLLDVSQLDDIKNQAVEILKTKGIFVENAECKSFHYVLLLNLH